MSRCNHFNAERLMLYIDCDDFGVIIITFTVIVDVISIEN